MNYFLLLGANMEAPLHQLELATRHIATLPGVEIIQKSSIQETAPYGFTMQAPFQNQVLEVQSEMAPQALLRELLAIETMMGRKREQKWGPRLIDIDILLAEDTILNEADLIVPHPDLHNRAFALSLLCEIASDTMHPILKKTVSELLKELSLPGGNT